MRLVATTFLLVLCIGGTVWSQDDVIHQGRYKRQIRKATSPNSKHVYYDFCYSLNRILVSEDEYGDCFHEKTGDIYLGSRCAYFGPVAHEVGHVIGLEHIHNRPDRDNYIEMNWTNIPEYEKQHEKMTEEKVTTYDVPYNYGSIMHYSSPVENPTMIPKDENYRRTISSPFISFTDLTLLNEHYKCKERCKKDTNSPDCKFGGYPHPQNCSRCLCPGGYGGDLCNERPGTCGTLLEAKADWTTQTENFYNINKDKNYYIVPAGSRPPKAGR
ncbi:hypothetical protein Aduo_000365 [Ancylostoma duodenale]